MYKKFFTKILNVAIRLLLVVRNGHGVFTTDDGPNTPVTDASILFIAGGPYFSRSDFLKTLFIFIAYLMPKLFSQLQIYKSPINN